MKRGKLYKSCFSEAKVLFGNGLSKVTDSGILNPSFKCVSPMEFLNSCWCERIIS